MQRKSSPRRRMARQLLIYIVMTVTIVLVVTGLVFVLLGYQLGKDGKLSQGGLVQFGSNPSGASVYIDGVKFGSNTTTQTTLLSGSHSFEYQKQGYRTWRKTLNLSPGSVLWVNYARLVPNILTPKSVATFDAVAGALASPDNSLMAVIPSASQPKLTVEDISGDQVKPIEINIPETSFTAPANSGDQTFTLSSWSADNNYLLVKHVYNTSSVEWLRINVRTPSSTSAVQNLTTQLAVSLSNLTFRPSNSNQIYALSDNSDLRLIDLGSQTISAPLATNVANYYVASDDGMLTYVTSREAKTSVRSLGYISDGSIKSQVLRTYTDDGSAVLRAVSGVYYGQRYISIAYGNQLTIMRADLPSSGDSASSSSLQLVRTETLPFPSADHLINSTRGRFVIAEKGTGYAVYDTELDRYTSATFSGTDANSDRTLGQLDNYVFFSVAGGELQLAEFDGANHQNITKAVPDLDVSLSPNGKYLYQFTTEPDGKVSLSREQMLLN